MLDILGISFKGFNDCKAKLNEVQDDQINKLKREIKLIEKIETEIKNNDSKSKIDINYIKERIDDFILIVNEANENLITTKNDNEKLKAEKRSTKSINVNLNQENTELKAYNILLKNQICDTKLLYNTIKFQYNNINEQIENFGDRHNKTIKNQYFISQISNISNTNDTINPEESYEVCNFLKCESSQGINSIKDISLDLLMD